MLAVSLVHAGPDAALARELGEYIERNCRAVADYALVSEACPLVEAIGKALSSDLLILLVSPHSVPRRLERGEWEPLFLDAGARHGTRIGYVVVADCPFPKVLLRGITFDSGRAIKRWIFATALTGERPCAIPNHAPAQVSHERLEEMWQSLADRPATIAEPSREIAHAFAAKAQDDFQSVFWVECRGASVACAAGDLGAQLGLRLPGELRDTLESIRSVCDEYRCLAVLAGASTEVVRELGSLGRTSVLLTSALPGAECSAREANERFQALSQWIHRPAQAPPSGQIRETLSWLLRQPEHWRFACQFARAAAGYYKFNERFAELFELAGIVTENAVLHRDRAAASEFARERDWILADWGRAPEAPHLPPVEPERGRQLAFW